MRISGLASGMNTDEIVAKLMSASRIPMDKLKQQKQLLEWKRDDYRNLNVKLMAFRDAAFNMRLEGSHMVKKASSSNEAAVSVTGTGTANDGRYQIEINKLATAASISSDDPLGAQQGLNTRLIDIGLVKDAKLKIGGAKGTSEITVTPNMTIAQLIGQVNNESVKNGVKVSYDENMDRLFFTSSQTGQNSNVTLRMESTDPDSTADLLASVFKFDTTGSNAQILQGDVDFDSKTALIDSTINSVDKLSISVGSPSKVYDFGITKNTTIGDFINSVNASLSKEGISADLVDGKLVMYNAQGKDINFSSFPVDGVLEKLGLDATPIPVADTASTLSIRGANAEVKFNGIPSEYESNTFTILGMNFTAKQENTGPIDIIVTHDVEAAFNNIKAFVDKYNEMIDEVNGKISERKYRDFPPLTDEQRKEMSEDDIKRWEERAKSGMLASDSLLSKGISDLRAIMYSTVSGLMDGQLNSLSQIGISSTIVQGKSVSGSYLDKGKLYIDETKLKQALTERPEEVLQLFRNTGEDSESGGNDGIAIKLHKQVSNLLDNITAKAGATGMVNDQFMMGKEMNRHDERIDRLTRRLEDLEARYYKQFAAMETYLNRMNAQSAWLAQQFSTGG
ncbi:flagellar filament capping protein FliD [Paenibacillus sp. 1P07SE]|uniref:flagellar filament capping protein FliD n=1 Tax=Paenibacillus sp. 1P07SE TaxID=3132209 RepID=UPI0039A4BEC1